jgi:flagellar basal-body rod protein FlgG
MTQGIHQLTASMVNQLNRVDTISNNIANANTVGFKEDSLSEGSFNNYLVKKKEEREEVTKLNTIMTTIPKIDGNYIDSKVGSIKMTGNKLDFALNHQDTFFKLQNPNGNIELTRDGSFKILDNQLVSQSGYKVLDSENNPIATDNDTFVSNISVVLTKFENLNKIGDNNYKAKNIDLVETVANNDEYILRGALENSNVNGIKSMVTLIEAQRKFEQSQKAIAGIDELNKKVIDSIGNGR